MNPFSARHSANFPELLCKLDGTIMLTTYQTGKVIMIGSDGERLTQLVRDFDRPMGVSFYGDMMAMALRFNITIFKNSPTLAKNYPNKPDTYDTLFYPTATNITSYIDTHDVIFSKQGLIGVNTAYSCLAKVDGAHSFEPVWFPPFIRELRSGDACHLNGVGCDESMDLRYVTAFGKTTEPGGWRTNKLAGGFLYDIKEQRYLCENLAMPHSPRVYNNELYVLLSAKEALVRIDRISGEQETIARVDGFIRGLSFKDNYAFIGVSKLRKSHTFGDLPIARKKIYAGVVIVDITTQEKIAEVFYDEALEEIYDVHFIDGAQKTNIINHHMIQTNPAIITPNYQAWIETNREEKAQQPKEKEHV